MVNASSQGCSMLSALPQHAGNHCKNAVKAAEARAVAAAATAVAETSRLQLRHNSRKLVLLLL
jgi:hypothetical protein